MALKVQFLFEQESWFEAKQLIQAYPFVMKQHLRDDKSIDDEVKVDMPENVEHRPNYIAAKLQALLRREADKKLLAPELVLAVQNDISQFTDIVGACERIKKTPIPYTYSLFIKKFVFIYTITMPFGFVKDFGYWSIPVVIFVFYALASLELIAEEIEDPFGLDANDLPTDKISKSIHASVEEIFSTTMVSSN